VAERFQLKYKKTLTLEIVREWQKNGCNTPIRLYHPKYFVLSMQHKASLNSSSANAGPEHRMLWPAIPHRCAGVPVRTMQNISVRSWLDVQAASTILQRPAPEFL
jgi:hypothetical protein